MEKIIELEQTCPACPSQWEGKLEDGRSIYIRYRGGWLRYGIADTIDDAVGNYVFEKQIGGLYDGTMTEEEMLKHTGLVMKGNSAPTVAG